MSSVGAHLASANDTHTFLVDSNFRLNEISHFWNLIKTSKRSYRKRKKVPFKIIAKENSRQSATPPLGLPTKRRLRNDGRNTILMTCYYPYLGIVLLIGWSKFLDPPDQSEALARSWWWRVIILNQWWRREMSAVFFGYLFDIQELQQANRKQK